MLDAEGKMQQKTWFFPPVACYLVGEIEHIREKMQIQDSTGWIKKKRNTAEIWRKKNCWQLEQSGKPVRGGIGTKKGRIRLAETYG